VQRFAFVLALLWGPVSASAQTVPPDYPADYATIIAAAEQEGSVAVYSTTDSASADALLKDFRALYPKVQIKY
jgi:iron(III) transport system substrate-binding protein